MSRQLRRVPARWKHPHYVADRGMKGKEFCYRPMYQRDFREAYEAWQKELADWYEGYKLWNDKGLYKSYDGELKPAKECVEHEKQYLKKNGYDLWHQEDIMMMDTGEYGYEQYNGAPPSPPSPNDYMPFGTWYQLFEEVSEGTPITPPFKTKQQLIDWLSENNDFWDKPWTREQAEAMIKDEWAPSLVMSGGKVYTPQESLLIKEK